MQPIPESVEAAEELGPFAGSEDLLEQLSRISEAVQDLVPECVGLSLASQEHGVTFTLVSSHEHVAVLDAAQYLDGGPCVESIHTGQKVTAHGDMVGEGEWRVFAQVSAATDVLSSLTLPIVTGGLVTGTVNLYASTVDAFDQHHEEVAQLLGAWAEGAVTNADLTFDTRRVAEDAPRILRQEAPFAQALGFVSGLLELDTQSAAQRLGDAARRAGISTAQLAEALIKLRQQ